MLHIPVEKWREIELACVAGMSYVEASKVFGVKLPAIRRRADRYKWPTPFAVAKRAKELATIKQDKSATLDKIAKTWMDKAEGHRSMVFEKTNKALKASEIAPPDNWHDFEVADKVARRSAGLDNAEVVQQTLVNINELFEEKIVDVKPTLEAEVVESA